MERERSTEDWEECRGRRSPEGGFRRRAFPRCSPEAPGGATRVGSAKNFRNSERLWKPEDVADRRRRRRRRRRRVIAIVIVIVIYWFETLKSEKQSL